MDQSNDSGTENEKPAKSPSKTEGNGRPKSRLGNRDKYSTKPIQNGTEPTSPKEEKQPVKVNRKPEGIKLNTYMLISTKAFLLE